MNIKCPKTLAKNYNQHLKNQINNETSLKQTNKPTNFNLPCQLAMSRLR